MQKQVTSRITVVNGSPRLFVNDEMIEGDSYITYYTDKNNYKQFTNIGFNIFSIPIYFSTRSINEISECPPLGPGIFDNPEGFDAVDIEVKRLLDINPNALIFLRVDTTLPKKWDDEHKDELNYIGTGNYSPRPCFASDIYLEAVKEHLTLLIKHIEQSDYCSHIFGYQLSGGRTQEWFACDIKGSLGLRLDEKYSKYLLDNNLTDNYALKEQFKSDQIAEFVCKLSKHVKQVTNYKLIVGTFYGYISAVPYSEYGHLGIDKMLECEDIDFLCSPIGYYTNRECGVDHPLMIPLASFNLHKKLFFAENDTRTDLSKAPNDKPDYNRPIWFGPIREKSLEICLMHFASSLCKDHTYWWFDMWGGWYDSQGFLSLFKKLKKISHDNLTTSAKSIAKIAFILDTRSLCASKDYILLNKTARDILPLLGNKGIQYDFYSSHDYDAIKDKYEVLIIGAPVINEKITYMANDFSKNGKKCILIDKDIDLIETVESLNNYRTFDQDVICYENDSYLYLMSNKELTLDYKKDAKLVSLLDDSTFPLKTKPLKGYLFKKL